MTSLTVQSMSGRTISPLLKNKFTKKTNKQILGIFLETQADEKKMMGFYFSQLVLFTVNAKGSNVPVGSSRVRVLLLAVAPQSETCTHSQLEQPCSWPHSSSGEEQLPSEGS